LRRQNQAIEQLIGLLNQERPVDEQRTLSLFAARALEYLVASESQVKALVELIFFEAANGADDEQFLRAVRHCAFCSAERRTFVRKLLLELIVKVFRKAEQPSVGNLFRAMSSHALRGDTLSQSSLFPADLQKDVHAAVQQIVLDRAATNEFFASVAWSWFGLINEDLLRRHGLATYFNTPLEQNHFGVDGLTNLVLGGSDHYARTQPFTQEYSLNALAAVGRVGFTGPMLDKAKFTRAFATTGAPLGVWDTLLKQYRKQPEVLAGAFFVFLLITALGSSDISVEKDPAAVRESIKTSVLNSRAIKKLKFYPQILLMAEGTTFDIEDSKKVRS
jgi:hypothetical protein